MLTTAWPDHSASRFYLNQIHRPSNLTRRRRNGWTARRDVISAERPLHEDNSINSSDLADAIAAGANLSKPDARNIVDAVFAAIADAAVRGEEIALNGLGKFKVKDSPARNGRNPATGEAMQIAASRKLGFTAAKAVKDKLNG